MKSTNNNNTNNNSKRNIRIEKKKKRMAALLEVSKLNASDRIKVARNATSLGQSVDAEQPCAKRLRVGETTNNAGLQEVVYEEGEHVDQVGQELMPNVNGTTLDATVDYIEGKMNGGGKQSNRNKRASKPSTKSLPKFWLRDVGTNAALSTELQQRIPLFMSDIQHLIMYAQLGLHSMYKPTRWCQLDKHGGLNNTNVLLLEGISMGDFIQYEKFAFPYLSSTFRHKIEIIAPQAYNGECVKELAMVPLSNTQFKKYIRLFGNMRAAEENCNEVFNLVRNVFPIDGVVIGTPDVPQDGTASSVIAQNNNGSLPTTDAFPRTELLMSGWQMVEENYPLPILGLMDRKYKGYVLTKDRYGPVTAQSPMFGLDCEMCLTTAKVNELTRISVVNEKHEVIYERLVKPYHMITDYLTQFSGITAKMLEHVSLRLEEVQKDLRKLFPADAILVGQSLGSDLHALKMMHPYVIDTSIIYNLTGDRQRKSKLKHLAAEFLRLGIQEGSRGHCSAEDSIASLQLAQHKLTKSLYYGDAVMNSLANAAGPSKQMQCKSGHPELVGNATFATSMLKQVTKLGSKRVQVMASAEFLDRYKYYTYKSKPGGNMKTIQNIKFTEINNNINSAVHNITKSAANYALNITHIRLKDASSIGPDNTVQYYGDLDTAIKRIAEASADPSLQLVVFTGGLGGVGAGHESAGNGCCFVNLKWPTVEQKVSSNGVGVDEAAHAPL